MKVLITGASSFTGYHFIKSLADSGAEVYATHTLSLDQYEGLKLQRLKELISLKSVNLLRIKFGTSDFISEIKRIAPDILCVHGAYVSNYKSLDFDINLSIEQNCHQLLSVFKALKEVKTRALIYTGSVFEGGEGVGSIPSQHFSPYGLSKSITGQILKYYCFLNEIRFGKFVIPNPFGIFEEKRFVNYLVSNWFNNKIPVVNTPLYIRDNIPVNLLSAYYTSFLNKIILDSAQINTDLKLAPTGIIGTNQSFADKVSFEFSKRLNKVFKVEYLSQVDFSEPLFRVNYDSDLTLSIKHFNESEFWDNYVSYYLSLYS